MLDGLFIASLVGNCVELIKEKFAKPIPAENWANRELYNKDLMAGMSADQLMKNVENGKYKGEVKTKKKYPEPHRNKEGKIVVENCKLYNEDVKNYDPYQVKQWVKQGKYNLEPEELEKVRKEFAERYRNWMYNK